MRAVAFAVLCGIVSRVQGYATGAPATACVTMEPQHQDVAPETTPPPFGVKALSASYRQNSTIVVFLSAPCGTETFGGFLLEARRADVNMDRNEPIGTFDNIPESQHVGLCGNGRQAVTHKNDDPKAQLTFVWRAPEQAVGHIVFLATFAVSRSSYWVKVASALVRDETMASDPDLGGAVYPTPTTCSAPPTQPPPPQLVPDRDCNVSKFCFADCQGSSCRYIISWRDSSEYPAGVEFELAAPVQRTTNTWLAIGFSKDRRMGEDKVVECVSFKDAIKVYTSYNRVTPRLENVRNEDPHPNDGVHQGNASLVDGIFRCSFVVVSEEFSYINLNESSYLLFATGNTATFRDTKLIHSLDQDSLPAVSAQLIDFRGLYRNVTMTSFSPSFASETVSIALNLLTSVILFLAVV